MASDRNRSLMLAAGIVVAINFLGHWLGLLLVAVLLFCLARRVAARVRKRHEQRFLIADFVERHSFPDDSVSSFVQRETGSVTLEQARARLEAWKSGYLQAERDAHERRSRAARRSAAMRSRTIVRLRP